MAMCQPLNRSPEALYVLDGRFFLSFLSFFLVQMVRTGAHFNLISIINVACYYLPGSRSVILASCVYSYRRRICAVRSASALLFLLCNHYITVITRAIITQGKKKTHQTHTHTHIAFESLDQRLFRF